MSDQIKEQGKNDEYDCLLGLSGGLDSSYMLHLAVHEYGLRPLVFHTDSGWNTDIAVNNINSLVEKLNLDLYTDVVNWEQMKDFQLAFFKSGLPHIDIPQDMAFTAALYKYALKFKIKTILKREKKEKLVLILRDEGESYREIREQTGLG